MAARRKLSIYRGQMREPSPELVKRFFYTCSLFVFNKYNGFLTAVVV